MLKEFLWGTSKEIQADQRYAKLSKRSRLSATQQEELTEVRHLSRRLFLRRGATVIGSAVALSTPVGTYLLSHSGSLLNENPEITSTNNTYDGPVNSIRGLEYVPGNSLIEMTRTLDNTGHPILEKIAKGIRVLYATKTRPQEFPDWVDERSFPFAFVQDNTNVFTTEFSISQSSGDRVKFVIPSQGVNEPQEGIDKLVAGIKLGLRNTPLSGELLQPSIMLAKEYLTLLHGIALNEEFYDLAKGLYPNVAILDASEREITDRSQQKAIGRRLLHNNLIDDNNDNWKLLDGFSMLMLGPVLRDLVVAGKIKNYGKIRSIVLAANLVTSSSNEFQTDLRSFMESWRLKEGFVFPTGTGAKITSTPYFNAIVDLQRQIDQSEKGSTSP